jgi:hypothetical protein
VASDQVPEAESDIVSVSVGSGSSVGVGVVETELDRFAVRVGVAREAVRVGLIDGVAVAFESLRDNDRLADTDGTSDIVPVALGVGVPCDAVSEADGENDAECDVVAVAVAVAVAATETVGLTLGLAVAAEGVAESDRVTEALTVGEWLSDPGDAVRDGVRFVCVSVELSVGVVGSVRPSPGTAVSSSVSKWT